MHTALRSITQAAVVWSLEVGSLSAAINFQDSFSGSLKPEWRWLDEDPSAWNLSGGRLNMRRYPGHGFYSGDNNRIPVLYYPGVPLENGTVAQVKVGFDVDRPYGQAGLMLFYDNNNWAKLVLEYWWNYGLHVIFLKEQNATPCHDKNVCEKDVFIGKTQVELRIRYENGKFITEFRDIGASGWTAHFTVDAIANRGPINIGLSSQADAGSNDWAWFDDFSLSAGGAANTAPVITGQPSAKTVVAGSSVTFSVTATGTPAPAYQWRKNGTAISGATSASFTIARASASDAGEYSVVVTNAAGSVTSANARLTVNPATGVRLESRRRGLETGPASRSALCMARSPLVRGGDRTGVFDLRGHLVTPPPR